MKDSDFDKFYNCMQGLVHAFGAKVPEKTYELYFRFLSDLPISDIERGVYFIINNRTTATFPKIAEIRQAVNGQLEDRALLALEKVRKAKWETKGGLLSVIFDDPIIHHIVSDWYEVCQLPESEWKWYEKDFLKKYRAFAGDRLPERRRLVGKLERENDAMNFNKENVPDYLRYATGHRTVVMGDRRAALQWTYDAKKQIESDKAADNTLGGVIGAIGHDMEDEK